MEAEAKAEEKKVCEICKFSDTNDFDYGKWSTSEDCTIHYFCAVGSEFFQILIHFVYCIFWHFIIIYNIAAIVV